MKANELRIGCLVNCGSDLCQISAIFKSHYNATNIESGVDYGNNHQNNYKPIPLTEEWLAKFGFESNGHMYSKPSDCVISFDFSWIGIYSHRTEDDVRFDCPKHVHQLQNLYFALTNHELEIKQS